MDASRAIHSQASIASPPSQPAHSTLRNAAMWVGITGVSLMVIGTIAALNQRFSFIPISPLANRITLMTTFAGGGVALAFSGGAFIYSESKSKNTSKDAEDSRSSTQVHPALISASAPLLTPAASSASSAVQPPGLTSPSTAPVPVGPSQIANEQRDRKLVLDGQKVRDRMAENLRLARASQAAEQQKRERHTAYHMCTPTFMNCRDYQLRDNLTPDEKQESQTQGLVPAYPHVRVRDFPIGDGEINKYYFAMSNVRGEGFGPHRFGAAHTRGLEKPMSDSVYMEDRHISDACLKLQLPSGKKRCYLSAVFDGHGGTVFAQYLAENLPAFFMRKFNELKALSDDQDVIIYNALKQAIVEIGKACDPERKLRQGSTVACTLIVGNDVYVANLGDSRTIYISPEGEPIQLSDDAKGTERFIRKVEKRGGIAVNYRGALRVNGRVATFGACGDLSIQNSNGASVMPQRAQVTKYPIAPGGTLVLMSDGVLDVNLGATTSDVGNMMHQLRQRNVPVNEMALRLVSRALSALSRDNITAVVVQVG